MSYVASLDVGTTSVRCFIFNENCQIKGSAAELVDLLNPRPGYFEIEPESLWQSIKNVISNAIKDGKLLPSNIKCLGISTQRSTFLTWNHQTNEYYHNFITWKDLRADALVDEWNSSYVLKIVNTLSYVLYLITRSTRFLAGSVIKMMNAQVTLRFLYEIQNNAKLQNAIKNKTCRIESLDSWILYKLRKGNRLNVDLEHISDITSCTATGIFDPFTLNWSTLVQSIFGFPIELLPKVVNNQYDFGCVESSIFGENNSYCIPITSSISDQTASLFGSNCFYEGDAKITLGTGAFLDIITGKHCHASLTGMYPLVAWKFNGENYNDQQICYCMEGSANDMGSVIKWSQSIGLVENISQSSEIAESVFDTSGLFFIPAFSGLGPPFNDYRAASGFLGISPSTTKAHMTRALLESIAFRIAQLCEITQKETNFAIKLLKVDGGVSKNNFVCQLISDISGIIVERADNSESSVLGSAFMAGINAGVWKDHDKIKKYRKIDLVFKPCSIEKRKKYLKRMQQWEKAVERFQKWY